MIQRTTRDYEVSLWSLQDSFIAILKQYGLEYKGQIENGKIQDRDDGTQTFSFTIPMYYIKEGKKIENPAWYSVRTGALLVNMRKIKVIFNKDNLKRKIYEFLIIKVKEHHDNDNSLYCDVECLGLAFHELGKVGYKISLSPDDFYNDDYEWSTTGKWYDGYGYLHTEQPIATIDYWNAKIFSTIDNWFPEVKMNWDSYSLNEYLKHGVEEDYIRTNDIISIIQTRQTNKIYEDDFVDSWKSNDAGKLVPKHITSAYEKARVNVNISESNIYNITQTLAELFGVFCKYVYEYDDNFHIIKRKVIYYNNFFNELEGTVDINYKYQTDSVSREIDSTDLVTKLFVKNVLNSNSESGLTNIINVEANKSKEDYILNFDYLYNIGGITELQYQAVQKYMLDIREINEAITPLSIQIMTLQLELVLLEAEFSVYTNAISKDNEEIYSASELLMSLTKDTGVLSISDNKPQIAVLFKDTTKSYDSYYVKISQKGVYPLTIHLYKTYSYALTQLSDEITTGQIEYDEYGNVIKISNIYVEDNASKTIYLTYDYKPSLYYLRIENMWKSRLMSDMEKRNKLLQDIGRINFILYGSKIDYDLTKINVGNVTVYNLMQKYYELIEKKENIIKEFNLIMGPAIREGYWQPEDYTDYGDKYTDNLSLGSLLSNQNNTGISGNTELIWDNKLFDNEQTLYYEYSAAQSRATYPCINLLLHPELLEFIKENIDNNVGFYFTPLSAESANAAANHRPVVNNAPKTITLVPNLYTGSNWNRNSSVTSEYGSNYDYSPYSGIILQTVTPGSYKVGYSYFYWQVKKSLESAWLTVTSYYDAGKSLNLLLRYGFFIVGDTRYKDYISNNKTSYIHLPTTAINYTNNIRFTHNEEYPWEIQVRTTDDMNMDGWQFRLIMGNNKGMNLDKYYEWDNAQYLHVTPTKIQILENVIRIEPIKSDINRYISLSLANSSNTFLISFNVSFNKDTISDYRYKIQYSYNNSAFKSLTSSSADVRSSENFTINKYDDTALIKQKIKFNHSLTELSKVQIRVLAYNIKNVANKKNGLIDYYFSIPSVITIIKPSKLYYTKCEHNLSIELDTVNKSIYANIYFAALESDIEYQVTWYKYTSTANLTLLENFTLQKQQNLFKDPITGLYVAKFELTQLNISKANELINEWDGNYICAHIQNINNVSESLQTEDYNEPLQIDICVPVVLITDLPPIQTASYSANSTYITYNIDTINANIFKWHIFNPISNSNVILQNNVGNLTVLEIEGESYRYQARMKTSLGIASGSILTIQIPANTSSNYYRDQGSIIYCLMFNASDSYHINENRSSYKVTSNSRLTLPGTVTIDDVDGNNVFERDLWFPKDNPNVNVETDWMSVPFELKFKKYTNPITSPSNINVNVSCSIPINVEANKTIPVYNNNNYTTNDNSAINYSGNKYVDVPLFKVSTNGSMSETANEYIYPIKLQTIISSYDRYQAIDTQNSYIFDTDSIDNDRKYGYYYRILITYNYNNVDFSEVFYMKGIIRQYPPIFNDSESARKWTYGRNNTKVKMSSPPGPATNRMTDYTGHKDYNGGAIFYTPAYLDSNGVKWPAPSSVAECLQWNHGFILEVSTFNFNMASIAEKAWDLPYGHYAHSKFYTGPNYDTTGVAWGSISSGHWFDSVDDILNTYDNYAYGVEYNKLTNEERNFWQRFKNGDDLPIIRYVTTVAVPGLIDLRYLVNSETHNLLWGLSERLMYVVSNTWGTVCTPYLVWEYNYSSSFKTNLDVGARFSNPRLLYQ